MRQYQCRLLQLCNDVGHSEGFAGTGDAQQCFKAISGLETADQLFNSLGLISGRLKLRYKFKGFGLAFQNNTSYNKYQTISIISQDFGQKKSNFTVLERKAFEYEILLKYHERSDIIFMLEIH